MKTRILITGASGNIGREVLKLFIQQKDQNEITVFDLDSKANRKVLDPYKNDIRIIYGDITKPEDSIKACKNQDFVIHMAAMIPPAAYKNPTLAKAVNVNGTKNLIHNLETHSPDAFIVFTSSVAVYGDRLENPNIRVTDILNPVHNDNYGQAKIKAEQLIQKSRLRWTIFRLSAIMGAGNHKISEIIFLMPLRTPIEITTPEDTAKALFNAANHTDKLNGRIFNLGGGKNSRITYRDFLQQNFSIYGLGKLDFPEQAFADKDYHCGYYADGDDLENILHFRQDTIDTYFEKVKKSIHKFTFLLTKLLNPIIKKVLLSKSKPYAEYKASLTKKE